MNIAVETLSGLAAEIMVGLSVGLVVVTAIEVVMHIRKK